MRAILSGGTDIGKKLTSRTDYLVNAAGDCHFFLSAKEDRVPVSEIVPSVRGRQTAARALNSSVGWDFGYTRTIQRTDGKLVTLYYYTTVENPEQHIAATIWTL